MLPGQASSCSSCIFFFYFPSSSPWKGMGAVSGAAAIPVVSQRERAAVALFPLRSKTTPNATQMGPHGQNVVAWWCLRALVQLCSAAVNGLNASGQEEAALGWQHPFLPRWLEAPWWHQSPLQVSRLKLSGSQFWKPFPKLMGEKSLVCGLTPGGAGTAPLGSVGLGLCGFWQVAPPCSPLGRWHCWGGTGVPVTPRGHRARSLAAWPNAWLIQWVWK